VLLAVSVAAAGEPEIELAMYGDPRVTIPDVEETISPELLPLWLQALAAPEADLQRQAADAIAMVHQNGLRDMSEAADSLMALLRREDLHPVVAQAVCRCLVVLDARQAADLLYEWARRQPGELARIVEPALARWDYRPIRSVWLGRLEDAGTGRRALVLAIEGLAAVGESEAGSLLLELARSPDRPADIRLAAARALGRLQTEGLEAAAEKLATGRMSASLTDRLAAASLLSGHSGPRAVTLLRRLAVDPEPAVAAIALERLLETDPDEVIGLFEKVKDSPDAKVRMLAARGLAARPAGEQIRRLAPMLDDRHPDVRRFVRRSLRRAADESELRAEVIAQGMTVLASDSWRGLQQAAILLVGLDHKQAAPRLVELLDFPRSEVFIAAAWGLGRLAVPETLVAIFQKAERHTRIALKRGDCDLDRSQQLAHMVEALGKQQYAPSDELLRLFIPKDSPFDAELRAAAVWGLGHLHAGRPDAELEKLLMDRLMDEETFMKPGEALGVRMMSAVSLARMGCKTSLDALKRYAENHGVEDPLGFVCAWGIQQLTGQPMPEPKRHIVNRGGWFLMPLQD